MLIQSLYNQILQKISFPKISIITPNFNGSQYLEETVLSVLCQGYPNLEYIIIDGGSTDNSVEIIKKYEKHLKYWVSEPDEGMYHAIQKGFERSTGEIMAWINSDDMYHKNSFFTVAEIFDSLPSVNWIQGASTSFDESGRTVYVHQSRRFGRVDFINHDFKWIQQESVFWRRSLWEKAGSNVNMNLKYAGDFALWLKFFSYEKLYVTHALVGGFRWRRSNQITIDHFEDYLIEVENLLTTLEVSKKDLKILSRYKKILAVQKNIRRLRLFRTEWITNRYREKHFELGKYIIFNRFSAKFVIAG